MIVSNAIELIGRTPIVEIPVGGARLLLKLERQNPGGSVKDRTALAMIEDAEQRIYGSSLKSVGRKGQKT